MKALALSPAATTHLPPSSTQPPSRAVARVMCLPAGWIACEPELSCQASAGSHSPAARRGSQRSFSAALSPPSRAPAASAAVAVKGSGASERPNCSSSSAHWAFVSAMPPRFSGRRAPSQPMPASSFQAWRSWLGVMPRRARTRRKSASREQ